MNASILVVEDDEDIANLVKLYLERDGATVTLVPDGERALAVVGESHFDLAILDINLPGIDGFDVLQSIRRDHSFPIVMLTARRDDADAVYGLGAGADEYVTKPFSPRVLVARVRAHLRRATGRGAVSRNITCGPLVLDTELERVTVDGREVAFAPREFAVLRFLLERRGKPASPEEIYDTVWESSFGDVASVAVHIQRIRRKIEPDPASPTLIRTRHGYGYFTDCGGAP